jgi:replicative DNA helicase
MTDIGLYDSPIGATVTEGSFAAADADDLKYREVPHNTEAEQELLGAILVNNDAATKVNEFLRPEHFSEGVHNRIYEAAMMLIERGEIANPVTLNNHFQNKGDLDEVGGQRYLARLAASATTIINAAEYGRIVFDLATRRRLIGLGEEVVNRAYEAGLDDPAPVQIEDAEAALFHLAEEGAKETSFYTFNEALAQSIAMIDAAHRRDGKLVGVASGLRDLDVKLGGLHPSDLLILAGRPAMGKSALAANIAFNAARAHLANPKDGAVSAFFSLEMSAEQLSTRLLADAAQISSESLRRGEISDDDFANNLVHRARELQNAPLFIDDTPALSISQLRTRARRLKRTHDLGLVVVDYLQLMRPSGLSRVENRVQEISEITRGLKAIAKELNVPVLALSQLSRAVEQRDDKRPQLADLRESGSIEQDADVVMFIFREEYYLGRHKPEDDTPEFEKWREKMERVANVAELIIGKQRHGPTGTVNLMFEPRYTAFRNFERPDHMAEGY